MNLHRQHSQAPGAAVVAVGNELLLGETIETNGAWLSRELEGLGIRVLHRIVVGDTVDAIQRGVAEGLEQGDVVVVTGGLGPTPDDITREAVAALLDLPLDTDQEVLGALRRRFRRMGMKELPSTNLRQAQVPRGAEVLPNPVGSAPGLAIPAGGKWVVLLPGIPREMRPLFHERLKPWLRQTFRGRLHPVHHRVLRTTGIPESSLAERVGEVSAAELGPVSLAFLPDLRGVELRLTVRGASHSEAESLLDRAEEALRPALLHHEFRATSGDLAEAVLRDLVAAGRTVASAESCTGGLVAQRITSVPGSSEAFRGGIVAYSNESKIRELGVSEAELERHGAVSRAVAESMASGVRRRFGCDVGIGVTGVAGPGGGTREKPVGTVWYAVDVEGRVEARRGVFPGERGAVRERAAQAVLWLLFCQSRGDS